MACRWSTTSAAGSWWTSPAFGLASEPRVADAVADGANLVVFSGDKLLGGPQAGCLVGSAALLGRCRTNPLARASRADKMTFAALEATLELYRDPAVALREIPVLRMLTLSATELQARAHQLAAAIAAAVPASPPPRLANGHSVTGGGSFPGCRPADHPRGARPRPARRRFPGARPPARRAPVVTRVEDRMVVLDPRTLPAHAFPDVAAAVAAAFAD